MLVKYLRDRYNVEVTLVGRSVDEYRKAVKSNTKVRMGYRQDIEMDSLTELELKCRLFYDRLLFYLFMTKSSPVGYQRSL